jgi:hypothetical protein
VTRNLKKFCKLLGTKEALGLPKLPRVVQYLWAARAPCVVRGRLRDGLLSFNSFLSSLLVFFQPGRLDLFILVELESVYLMN